MSVCTACPCCDFCRFYAFNGDDHGIYLGTGRCEHPEHPRASDPADGCEDFECETCNQEKLKQPEPQPVIEGES